MKFQIPFYRNFKYFDENKIEISIIYKPKIKEIANFLKKYLNYRINIIIPQTYLLQDNDYKIFKVLKETYPDINFVIRCCTYTKEIEEKLNLYNIPHYYQYICCNWEDFFGFCSLNVTDIRIGGNLAFMLEFTSFLAKKNKKRLRCFCNYCEKKWDSIPTIKNFFIRPEDIPYYSNFIDTFEFFPLKNNKSYNTLYEIFAINHKWYGRLKEIIYNYQEDEDNRTILPEFGEYRTRCQRKCLINSNSCKICDEIIELSHVLENKDIIIKRV